MVKLWFTLVLSTTLKHWILTLTTLCQCCGHTIQCIHNTIGKPTSKHNATKLLLYGDFHYLDYSSIPPTFGLSQIVHFSTRSTAIRDNLFTNISVYMIAGCDAVPLLSHSDHKSVDILSDYKNSVPFETILFYIISIGFSIIFFCRFVFYITFEN